MMSGRDWRTVTLGAAGVVIVGGITLSVQHYRHGWPFSLHHGAHTAPVAATRLDKSATAHARTAVELDANRLASFGVRLERVRKQTIATPLRAVATVVPDEARISHVHTRVAGWVEQLHVNTTGQVVRAGQPLAGIFSQELLASQTEYLSLLRAGGESRSDLVLQGAKSRLRVFGMTDQEIAALGKAEQPARLVTIVAPRTGIVIHRGISAGTAVDPSTELLTIADLSRVWLVAEVPEHAISGVRVGTPATIDVPGSGRTAFESKVEFVYPTLSERTRTVRVRFSIDNRDGALRPGLYGSADFQVAAREALTVPRDAVVDTGETQHVFVAEREGRLAPRTIKLGARLQDVVEITNGLSEGETIVASGVFLIDSESRLRASGEGTGHAHGARSEPKPGSGDHGAHADTPHEGHKAP